MGLGLGLGVDVSQLWTEPLLLVHPGQMVVSADATNDSTYMGAGSGEHGGSVATAHRPVPTHSPVVLLAHLITLM